jgi:pyruvate dehydrogenase E1 component subunit alpha
LCIFGDGAVNEGEFHESLNLAAVWKLPVIFLCENNGYGMGTEIRRVSAVTEVYKRACAYDIPSEQVDGMKVLDVYEATRKAGINTGSGQGPSFVEAIAYRFRGHSMADPEFYRSKEETESVQAMDPIATFRRKLEGDGVIEVTDAEALQAEVEEEVNDATRFAEDSPHPPVSALYEHVYRGEAS